MVILYFEHTLAPTTFGGTYISLYLAYKEPEKLLLRTLSLGLASAPAAQSLLTVVTTYTEHMYTTSE
jgi:hypothetical protein